MRVLIQRVRQGSVTIDGQMQGKIGAGMVILCGVGQGDTAEAAAFLAKKTAALRIFSDEAGKMNLSVKDIGGEILVISQFTLYADTSHGNRPGFGPAAPPELAEQLYLQYVADLRAEGIPVQTGVFGADMQVEIHNDGPITILLER